MNNQLQQSIQSLLVTVFSGVLSVLGVYATIYINKAVQLAKTKAQSIQDEKARVILNDTMDKLQGLIKDGLEATETTVKKNVVNDILSGKVDKSALNQLAVDLKEDVVKKMGDEGMNVLNAEIGNVDKYIADKIESTLGQLKLDPSSPVQPLVLPQDKIEQVKDSKELQDKVDQLNLDKEAIAQQLSQISSDKAIADQTNAQLSNEKANLSNQVQALQQQLADVQAKYNAILSVVQPVVNSTTATVEPQQPEPLVNQPVQQ